MTSIKSMLLIAFGYLLTTQQVLAGGPIVPEIDGSGAIIAIGLLAGLVALFREKFFRK